MTPPADTPFPRAWLLPLISAVLFAFAHTQSPLYYSNQNQYFLHGLAEANTGDLASDWLANTRDPTPLFSSAVRLSVQFVGTWPFHAAYFALIVVYFLSLWGIASALPFFPRTTAGQLALAAGLIALHAAILRAKSVELFGVDYPWYFQAGVANQYLLGPGLQPSAFGVLLLTALWAWVARRPLLAGALMAFACGMHSTYLLPAGLLVGGMIASALARGERAAALRVGVVALLGVAPVIVYVLTAFAPTDKLSFVEGQRILAWERIPHHTDVNRWLDLIAGLQLGWAVLGLAFTWRTQLFPVVVFASAGGLMLSLVQVATGDATLALLFPWRISAVLNPVATVTLAAALAGFAERRFPSRSLSALSGLTLLAAVGGAIHIYAEKLGYQQTAAEDGLIRFVRETHQPGDVYLLPTRFAAPSTKRGTAALTFAPVVQTSQPTIFELQRFRLGTGAAVYIDFKSVPYRDDEVLEWHRRVEQCAAWYSREDWDATGTMAEVVAAKVTHVVVPAGVVVQSERLALVFADAAYQVLQVR